MLDWHLQCTECLKQWVISRNIKVMKLLDLYPDIDMKNGKKQKVECIECQAVDKEYIPSKKGST